MHIQNGTQHFCSSKLLYQLIIIVVVIRISLLQFTLIKLSHYTDDDRRRQQVVDLDTQLFLEIQQFENAAFDFEFENCSVFYTYFTQVFVHRARRLSLLDNHGCICLKRRKFKPVYHNVCLLLCFLLVHVLLSSKADDVFNSYNLFQHWFEMISRS